MEILFGVSDKCENLSGKEILSSDKNRIIEQAKLACSAKKIENQGRKQVETLKVSRPNAQQLVMKDVVPKDQLNEKAKNEIKKIKEIEKKLNREDLVFETKKYAYHFKQFKIIRLFAKTTFNGKITSNNASKVWIIILKNHKSETFT